MLRLFPVAFLMGFASSVFAQVSEPDSVEAAIAFVPMVMKLFGEGKYLMAGAFITLVLVFAVKKYLLPSLGLGNGVLPLVSAIIGLVSGFAVSVAGGADMHGALLAMLSGPVASSFWDAILKYFFKKPEA